MLERTPSTLEMPAPSTAPVYRGKDLARQGRRGNATERALLAVEIAGATVTLTSQLPPRSRTRTTPTSRRCAA